MRSAPLLVPIAVAIAFAGCNDRPHAPAGEPDRSPSRSPYVSESGRRIKALSSEEVAGYLAGEGMGLARAAELNGYPGPRHVLDLADTLRLTASQRREVEASFQRMRADAMRIGRGLVGAESSLDSLFASGPATPEAVLSATASAATFDGELRAAHLLAHIETKAALSPAQVAAYERARRYGNGRKTHAGAHSGHEAHGQ
jgi:hypothetical protein